MSEKSFALIFPKYIKFGLISPFIAFVSKTARAIGSGFPLSLITAMPPFPAGVDNATIVSILICFIIKISPKIGENLMDF